MICDITNLGHLYNNKPAKGLLLTWFLFYGILAALPTSAFSGSTLSASKSAITEQLPQKTVQQAFRDESGFLWLVSQEGIHRTDGKNLSSYNTSAEMLTKYLPHDDVRKIIQTSNGDIWLATNGGGLLRYDKLESRFMETMEVSKFSKNITAIFEDSERLIWLGTVDGKVVIFNPSTGVVRAVRADGILEEKAGLISVFAQDPQGRIYIGTEMAGVFTYSYGRSISEFIANQPNNHMGKVSSIEIDSQNYVWVGTERKGVLKVAPSGLILSHYIHDPEDPLSISSDTVNDILEDSYGRLWIGTDFGISILPRGEKKFFSLNSGNSKLVDDLVLNIYQDREDTFWVGTNFGLYHVIDSQFSLHQADLSGRFSAITSFAESDDGQIWIGGYQDIFVFDEKTLTIKAQDALQPLLDIHKQGIMALELTGTKLWIGYRNNGLANIDLETLSTSLYATNGDTNQVIPNDSISSIQKRDDDSVLVSTYGGGMITLDSSTGGPRVAHHEREHQRSDRIICFYATRSGATYVGTASGLSLMSEKNQNLSQVEILGANSHLNDSVITAIYEDTNENLWIGTQYDGLYIWPEKSRLARVTQLEKVEKTRKLPSPSIYAIEEDQNGYLWISTANGLIRMDPHTLDFVTFDHRDGLQDNEFNIGASFKDSKGFLYFGGERGFNRFDPSKIVVDTTPPKVVLTSARFADTSLDYDESYLPPEYIHLSHKDSFATFSFSALEFREHAQIKYRYMLENYGSEWIELGDQHSLTLSNLPSGVYGLKVRAAGADGVWAEEGLDVDLYVHAPPWLDWYAFSLYSAFVFGMGIFIRKYYDTYALMESANRMALRMELTAEQSLDNLEEQLSLEQKLSGNVHKHIGDMLDLLSGSFVQQGEYSNSAEFREQIHSNQQRIVCLKHLENNLHFFGDLVVIELQAFANEYSQALCSDADSSMLTIVPAVEVLDIKLDASIALPVGLIIGELLRNSIEHAFIGSSGVQTVSIVFRESDDHQHWILELRDSGSGLPDNVDPQVPLSSGLDLVRHCAAILKASYEVQRGAGTLFRFNIPRPGQ